ncbi:MAG TPA: hypothetical protein VNE41_06395 [Chitinophagaceae bacterium]|nr:hypothetical protein [Chitinophagaceae bacterium]
MRYFNKIYPVFFGILLIFLMGCKKNDHPDPSHVIPISRGIALTRKFRDSLFGNLTKGNTRIIVPLAESFDKASLEALLNQDSCQGMRIYLGMDGKNTLHFILVGTGPQNNDLVPPRRDYQKHILSVAGSKTGKDILLENGQPCPPGCDPRSPLD